MPYPVATSRKPLPGWLAQPEAALCQLAHPLVVRLLPGRLVRPEAMPHSLWDAASLAARGGRWRVEM